MLKKIIDWISYNKLAAIILSVIIVALIFKSDPNNSFLYKFKSSLNRDTTTMLPVAGGKMMQESYGAPTGIQYYPTPATPNLNITDRKMISQAYLSLQVEKVGKAVDEIKQKTEGFGGYVVNVSFNRPDSVESANLVVRVPADKVTELVNFAKNKSVKVVNENTSGYDITDQYSDLDTRLAQLAEQKTMLEKILRQAVTVEDIMSVRPYLAEVQNEIDSVKGQMKYYDESSKSSLITMELSTELSYTPENTWSPSVIFKNATRSLVVAAQTLGAVLIWLAVYSIVLVPALTIIYIILLVRKRRRL